MQYTILIAHYDPRRRQRLREMIIRWGYRVEEARDGLEAVERARQIQPDLILLYAPLPRQNTLDTCLRLRQVPALVRTPIVIFSDIYRGRRFRDEACNLYQATEVIAWPLPETELRSLLERWIHKSARKRKPTARIEEEIERKLSETLAGLRILDAKPHRKKPSAPPEPAQPQIDSEDETVLMETPKHAPSPPVDEPSALFTSEDIFGEVLDDIATSSTEAETDVAASPQASEAETRILDESEIEREIERIVEQTFADLTVEPATAPSPGETVSTPEPEHTSDTVLMETPPMAPEPDVSETPDETVWMETPVPAPAPTAEHPPTESPPDTAPEPTPVEAAPVPAEEAPTVMLRSPEDQEGIPFGPYILIRRIATGGMAELFLAKKHGMEGFEKTLAIKRILPHMATNEAFITMFIDEAKVAARLTHPNIVQIFDLGRIGDDYFIAMEYVHGKDLRTVMQDCRARGRPFPLEVAAIIGIQLCAALDYAYHAKDDDGRPLHVVHRDVSPQNILISYSGDVKLTDFGVAKAAIKMHTTLSGALKGKLLYMSPEQAASEDVDHRSDIYAVGILLYEMVTGRHPFYVKGDTEVTLLDKVRAGRYQPLSEVSPDLPEPLVRVIERALQFARDQRYPRASVMQTDLEQFLLQRGIAASKLYIARLMSELYPDEAEPLQEIQEKIARLPRPSEEILTTPTVQIELPATAPSPSEGPLDTTAGGPLSAEPSETTVFPTKTLTRSRTSAFWIIIGFVLVVLIGVSVGLYLRHSRQGPTPRAEISEPHAVNPSASVPSPSVPQATAEAPEPPSTTTPPAPPPEEPPAAQEEIPASVRSQEAPTETELPPAAQQIEAEPQRQSTQQQSESAPPAQKPPPARSMPAPSVPPVKPEPPAPAPTEPTPAESPEPEPPAPTLPEPTPAESTPSELPAPTPGPPTTSESEPSPPAAEPTPPEAPLPTPGDLVPHPDQPPRIIEKVQPVYPAIARTRRLSDTVILRVLVDENGQVLEVEVVRAKYPFFRAAAVEAVRKFRFAPARHRGVPVKSWIIVPIRFQYR